MAAINPIQVQKFLKGIDYPADKETVLSTARENGADDNVMETLRHLSWERFDSPNDVSETIDETDDDE